MPDAAPVHYFDPAFRADPTRLHATLVSGPAVRRVDEYDPPFHVVGHYDDVVTVLRQHRLWQNGQGPGVEIQEGGVLGSTDQPDHTRQRRVLQRAFTPTVIAALEPRIRALVDGFLDRMLPLGEGDVVELLTHPLPAVVIAELFGVPEEHRGRFKQWATDIVNGLGGIALEQQVRTRKEMGRFLLDLVDDRLRRLEAGEDLDPDDDMLTRMAVAAHRDGLLSRPEMVSLAVQLLVAGHETTTSLLGFLLHRFATEPAVFDTLRADPTLIDVAVEEAVRLDGPVQGLFRTAPVDTELFGVPVPAHSKVQVMFAAANRDPAVWHHPDEFRLDRSREELRRHLGFGHGIHLCIGAPLARLETRLTVQALVDRVTSLHLVAAPTVVETFILRGYTCMPMRWTVTPGAPPITAATAPLTPPDTPAP
jgi:cytochrome P450